MNDRDRAQALDRDDPLSGFRNRFHLPEGQDGHPVLYFTGNSLGLQPVDVRETVVEVLDEWARLGVEGHFDASDPWMPYHEHLSGPMARIVGANRNEVVAMNSLTVNLHLLMASFYRPGGKRDRIAIEQHAFPSDRYAVRSHMAFRGVDPGRLLELPQEEDAAERTIEKYGDELALVLLGGVNYYSGRVFDMKRLCTATHRAGAVFGLDLAHAAGNVALQLHDWDVDFAAWCSYKYLNAGPGGPSGVFVHERHGNNPSTPRLAGWWGHDKESRFDMPDAFRPILGAEGWQLSNPPILAMAALKAALAVFDEAAPARLQAKSRKLTGYLIDRLQARCPQSVEILTPVEPDRRGAQLSLRITGSDNARGVFDELHRRDVICDWREPDVIRVAPVPLYNSFTDVFAFVERLRDVLTV